MPSLRQLANRALSPIGLKVVRSGKRTDSERGDDYDWSAYHREYAHELSLMQDDFTQKLEQGNFDLTDGTIKLREGLRPLHPNHACLYETVGALAPASVIEVGCGGGDHLNNIHLLYPDIELRGLDRSESQLDLLRRRSPHLAPLVEVRDLTLPPSADMPTADFVFTQAVIMHIHAGNGHLVALSNMFRMAKRFVVLMENYRRHPLADDIRRLHDNRMIEWDDVRLYFRRYDGKPHLLVASREALPFEELESYRQLTEAMAD